MKFSKILSLTLSAIYVKAGIFDTQVVEGNFYFK